MSMPIQYPNERAHETNWNQFQLITRPYTLFATPSSGVISCLEKNWSISHSLETSAKTSKKRIVIHPKVVWITNSKWGSAWIAIQPRHPTKSPHSCPVWNPTSCKCNPLLAGESRPNRETGLWTYKKGELPGFESKSSRGRNHATTTLVGRIRQHAARASFDSCGCGAAPHQLHPAISMTLLECLPPQMIPLFVHLQFASAVSRFQTRSTNFTTARVNTSGRVLPSALQDTQFEE